MMGRSSSCDRHVLKKGPWTPEEDRKLVDCIQKHGYKTWRTIPKLAGLKRCGLSCRLRWTNYLRPGIKRGKFSEEEEQIVINLHRVLGNKWSAIATLLPGRTDNDIKNVWNSHLKKKLLQVGIDPITHRPRTDLNFLANLPQLLGGSNFGNSNNTWDVAMRLQSDVTQLAKIQLLHNILQALNSNPSQNMEALNLLGSSFPDQQLAEFLPINLQFEGDTNLPFVQDDLNDQVPPNISNFESPHTLHPNYLALEGVDISGANYYNNNQIGVSSALASSPESSSVNQVDTKMNPNDIFNVSSTSNALEGFGDLLDDEALLTMERDFSQASLEPWSFS